MDKIFLIIKDNEQTSLKLKNFRNKRDGSSDVDIEYDEVFLERCKKELNKEEIDSNDLSSYITTLIEKSSMGIDGYKMIVEDV